MDSCKRRGMMFVVALLLTQPLFALDQGAEIVALAEMPLATARVVDVEAVPAVEVGDVAALLNDLDLDPIDFLNVMRFLPLPDVREFLLTLRNSDIPPADLVEIVRYVPAVIDRRVTLVEGDDDIFDLDDYYAARHDEGLRGTALAASIHKALRARGVPAGPKNTFVLPVGEGYIPDVVRERAGRTAGLPPGQAKKVAGDRDARAFAPGHQKEGGDEPSKARSEGRKGRADVKQDRGRPHDRGESSHGRGSGKGNRGKGRTNS